MECANCGSDKVETKQVVDRFQYGVSAAGAVWLDCLTTFHHCKDCSFDFTGGAAEDERDAVIREHLKLLKRL